MSSLALPNAAVLVLALFASEARAHERLSHPCGLLDPALMATAPAVPSRPNEIALASGTPRVSRVQPGPPPRWAKGALTGKTVYVSAGHGWTWMDGAWKTQRPTMEALIEDLVSAETVTQYLIPYLRNMGAYVVPVRDPDFQTELVIVDDAAASISGALDELSSVDSGWGELALPLTNGTNPFDAGGTRLFATSSTDTGRLVYSASIPTSGYYNVYVSYVQGPDRASDAHYVVAHAGGSSHVRVDQRRHGMTWVMLGRYWFEKDGPAEVSLRNDSADAASGAVLSADAVRFGAGKGQIDRGGGASDRPMWEQSCRYNAQLSGAPISVYDPFSGAGDMSDDVASRPRFAAWDHEPGEDAVYVAWHTNGSVQRGTESFTYSPFGANGFGTQADFTGVPGSLELQNAVHDRLIDDLRTHWDPDWIDRGKKTAYFGEVNPANNPEMPAVLLEVAFHDHPTEADELREPRFRQIAARAIARGIAQYFAESDGRSVVLPPEPPGALRVENDGGALRVSWRPPADGDAAVSGYRLYLSEGGYAFDDGREVADTSFVLDDVVPGDVRYVRVAAVNEGGESLPSEVVGARVSATGSAPLLVVGGFDRLDAAMMPFDDLSAFGMDPAQRMLLDRMNDGSYAARHGAAIAAAGYSFDGATDEAVDLGDVDLLRYAAVDWFGGEVSLGDEPFRAAERDAIRAQVDGGGCFFVSGSELAWALDLYGTPEEQTFYRDVFRSRYEEDDSETYELSALDGPFEGMAALSFDDFEATSYDADFPDLLATEEGATAALGYAGGIGGTAAVAWSDARTGAKVVNFGFPFETIAGAEARRDVMQRTLEFCGIPKEETSGSGGAGGSDGAGGAALGGVVDAGVEGDCSCRAGRTPLRPGGLGMLAFAMLALARRRRR